MKMAQIASYVDLGFPPEIRETLAQLQTLSAPMAPMVAARIVYEEFGKRPDELFAEWNPRPFASASIGQVHLAKLKSGQPVAVKIQYPGILECIERDLDGISFFQLLTRILQPRDGSLLEEIRTRLREECDYEIEAENQERFANQFKHDPQILVPRVHALYSSKRILTMDFVEGKRFKEFLQTATQSEKDLAGEIICRFHSQSIFRHGVMHADPHPGNFLFLPGKVAFLDFGRTVPYPQEVTQREIHLYHAIFHRDRAEAKRQLAKLDLVRDWETFDFKGFWDLLLTQQRHHLENGPFRFTPEYASEIIRRTTKYPQKGLLRADPYFFWANCMHFGLWSILGELRAESNWRAFGLALLEEQKNRHVN